MKLTLLKTKDRNKLDKLVAYSYAKTANHRGDIEFWLKDGVEHVKIYVLKNSNGDNKIIFDGPVKDLF